MRLDLQHWFYHKCGCLQALGAPSWTAIGNRLTFLPKLYQFLPSWSVIENRLIFLPKLHQFLPSWTTMGNGLTFLPKLHQFLPSGTTMGNGLTFLPKLYQFPPPLTALHRSTEWLDASKLWVYERGVLWVYFETFFKVYSFQSVLLHSPTFDSFEVINGWNINIFLTFVFNM